ncbi:MAG: hypothetical protein A2046_12910 [Bacteroidetes bacterium GWA2_30_7]|nr:MAG: hypothetical protein A2046_12910 [Bacteroidetes bacterium GWA2_30_7]
MPYRPIKVAILSMYLDAPNQGMKNIKDILDIQVLPFEWKVFDVRGKNEVPGLEYDIYISTGGPGSPLDVDGIWDKKYFNLIDKLREFNKVSKGEKKFAFFICHSFQMICHYYNLGQLTKRNSTSFGIFPLHKTEAGMQDAVLAKLPDPFYGADTRDWQIIQPNLCVFESFGAKILCMEKIRDHVDYERAIMAVRLSDEFFCTQFHPEADAIGMSEHFKDPDTRKKIIETYGLEKLEQTAEQLNDPSKISLTNRVILPTFLKMAVNSILQNSNKTNCDSIC